MFKLNIYNLFYCNSMSLSKKNLGKLNTFIKNNNLSNNNQKSDNSPILDDPKNIFYSIIDNSDNIHETTEVNKLLKKSEESFNSLHSKKFDHSNNLSIEDQLYDEFNYLLDE